MIHARLYAINSFIVLLVFPPSPLPPSPSVNPIVVNRRADIVIPLSMKKTKEENARRFASPRRGFRAAPREAERNEMEFEGDKAPTPTYLECRSGYRS